MQRTCEQCQASFEIDAVDEEFFRSMGVLVPVDCPDCRRQRRLSFRNFFNLYHRTCDLSGKKIISMYNLDCPFPVFEMHEWWGDRWDAFSYGKQVNFNKSFFEQVAELHRTVPRMSIMNTQCENSDYCNMAYGSRNGYLVFGYVHSEDCAYGHIVWHSKDCYDCLYCYRCQLCYECVDCVQCYAVSFSRDCDNCSSSAFLFDCAGCQNCFGCVGLKHKEYQIFNLPYSKEEYESKLADMHLGDYKTIAWARTEVDKLIGRQVVKLYHGFHSENVTGDYLYNCKNIVDGYDLKNCEDCRHCATLESFRDSQDCNFSANECEHAFNCLTSYGQNILCCQGCMSPSSDIAYCDNCFNCKDCIGCVGLKQKQYCILNKQYSKEEYIALRNKIIEHMRIAGEWGQFFPYDLSPFYYNETIAFQYFPLTQEEVLARGWRWKDMDTAMKELASANEIPPSIGDVSDDVTKRILCCEATGKAYKIIPQELAFYRRMNIPIPHLCFDERHRLRMKLRNPRHLWDRSCAKCGKAIQTTYAPERPEIVYCELCYLESVY